MNRTSISSSPPPGEEAAKGQIRQTNEALILAAAERVFAGAGFAGATMAAIAEAACLPKANLHYYFGSKQALYRAVLARTLEDWLVPTLGITPRPIPGSPSKPIFAPKWLCRCSVRTLPGYLPTSSCTVHRS